MNPPEPQDGEHPPEALRAFPPLCPRCAREGGRRWWTGAAGSTAAAGLTGARTSGPGKQGLLYVL
ncbi:MAG TPA: hypothetical protein DIC45_14795 [Comamonadaceae bacterium]|nr:hypothetical protein [Comamonadaceae bacterium]